MPFRRKIFRIEETRSSAPPRVNPLSPKAEKGVRNAPAPAPVSEVCQNDLQRLKVEAGNIFHAINHTKQAIAALHVGGLSGPESGRVQQELDAVIDGTEQAIHQILSAAEDIDDAANTLSAVLKQQQNQALAEDIRDHVIRIFEACNFQDLAGQRIGKVLATLQFVEDRIAHMMEIWGGIDALADHAAAARAEIRKSVSPLLNGPKLRGDTGHASQDDIDALFRFAS